MLDKLYPGTDQQVIQDIMDCYKQQGYAVVNFLYFANAMQFHLFETPENEKDRAYALALREGDFLLPDGIALQLRHYVDHHPRQRVSNLNGTDLTPKLLSYLSMHYDVELFITSLYDERIGKGKEWLDIAINKCKEQFHIQNIYGFQTHFLERGTTFPWEEWGSKPYKEGTIRVMLHCTGTPFQEMWTQEHKQWYKDHHMLVVNAGGFIDFLAGFEKRAPKRVVKARVLETFWRITTNPKKNLKKFVAMFGVWRVAGKRMKKALLSSFTRGGEKS